MSIILLEKKVYNCDLYIFKTHPIIVCSNLKLKEIAIMLDNTNCSKINIRTVYNYFSSHRDKIVYIPDSKDYAIVKISNNNNNNIYNNKRDKI